MVSKSLLIFVTFVYALACSGTTYYISNNTGNDMNAGISPSAPWKSINKVNTTSFLAGDSILFKSNDSWREQLILQSGNPAFSTYYGKYGSGLLPQLRGSLDMSELTDWTHLGSNLWKCNFVFPTDVGNIIFDNALDIGAKKWGQSNLQFQNDFWFDLSSNEVYLYSIGNPASIYSEIELALREDIIDQSNTSYVLIKNLSLKYGGAHGIGGANTSNIHINSCEISFIGGGDLNMDGIIRYGNGVEFWGNAADNIVSNCKIWEIYDTGLTNQNHSTVVTQENIKYQNNLIWNCGLSSFEFWCKPASSTVSNIHFENNSCAFAGGGWGAQRPDYHGVHILISGNSAQTDTVYVQNNIFFQANRTIYAFADSANGQYLLDFNSIYQSNGLDTLFALFPSNTTFTNADSINYNTSTGNDLNSIFNNPNFVDVSNYDFRLTSNSTAIDAGKTLSILEDIEGNSRPYNNVFDIGAYEYTGPLLIRGIVSAHSVMLYPNPTKNQFRIQSSLQFQSDNTLHIINTHGKIVLSVKNYSNNDSVDISHLQNGVYSFIIKANSGENLSGKFVIQ